MKVYGIQKLTLLDYPGKMAATLFFGSCNLRCPFCHNAHLVTQLDKTCELDESEVFSFLKKRVGILDGVTITGGEPLCSEGIFDFIKKVKELGYSVKLDTNGTFPEKLRQIAESGYIDYVAMDIKNSLESYGKTVGIENFDTKNIEESADFLMNGSLDYEFRTTVVKQLHTESDFESMGKRFSKAKAFYLQKFVNSGALIGEGLCAWEDSKMKQFRDILSKYCPKVELRGM